MTRPRMYVPDPVLGCRATGIAAAAAEWPTEPGETSGSGSVRQRRGGEYAQPKRAGLQGSTVGQSSLHGYVPERAARFPLSIHAPFRRFRYALKYTHRGTSLFIYVCDRRATDRGPSHTRAALLRRRSAPSRAYARDASSYRDGRLTAAPRTCVPHSGAGKQPFVRVPTAIPFQPPG